MTKKDCKNKILKRYTTEQTILLRYRVDAGRGRTKITERRKAKILKLYPRVVLCEVDNFRECFTYQELHRLTTY